ncbi:MAG: vWA domain-containing protein [Acidobacteriaceae bacterium]
MKHCIAICIVIGLGSCALAQSASVGPVQLRAHSELVQVPTLVKTKTGDLVFSLPPEEFTILDDGVQQKVTLDAATSRQPIALVIAIQTGGAAVQQLPNFHHLETMVEVMVGNVPHHIALIAIDSKPHVLQNFTPNLGDIGKATQGLRPGDGGAAILDGLAVSINLLRKQPPAYRRAILLISGTVDHGSQTRLSEALRIVSETNTVIYSMAFSTPKSQVKTALANTPPSPSSAKTNTEPNSAIPTALPSEPTASLGAPTSPHSPSDPNTLDYSLAFSSLKAAVDAESSTNTLASSSSKGCSQHATQSIGARLGQHENCASFMPLVLFAARLGINGLSRNTPKTVARLTGGEYEKFSDEQSLERGLFVFANHLPNRYILSFQPALANPGLHTIQVRLKNYPKLQIAARTSYWVAGETSAGAKLQ